MEGRKKESCQTICEVCGQAVRGPGVSGQGVFLSHLAGFGKKQITRAREEPISSLPVYCTVSPGSFKFL